MRKLCWVHCQRLAIPYLMRHRMPNHSAKDQRFFSTNMKHALSTSGELDTATQKGGGGALCWGRACDLCESPHLGAVRVLGRPYCYECVELWGGDGGARGSMWETATSRLYYVCTLRMRHSLLCARRSTKKWYRRKTCLSWQTINLFWAVAEWENTSMLGC